MMHSTSLLFDGEQPCDIADDRTIRNSTTDDDHGLGPFVKWTVQPDTTSKAVERASCLIASDFGSAWLTPSEATAAVEYGICGVATRGSGRGSRGGHAFEGLTSAVLVEHISTNS